MIVFAPFLKVIEIVSSLGDFLGQFKTKKRKPISQLQIGKLIQTVKDMKAQIKDLELWKKKNLKEVVHCFEQRNDCMREVSKLRVEVEYLKKVVGLRHGAK